MSDTKSKDFIETITIIPIVLNNFSLAHIQNIEIYLEILKSLNIQL